MKKEIKEILVFIVLMVGVPATIWFLMGPTTFFEKFAMLIINAIVAVIMFFVSIAICEKWIN